MHLAVLVGEVDSGERVSRNKVSSLPIWYDDVAYHIWCEEFEWMDTPLLTGNSEKLFRVTSYDSGGRDGIVKNWLNLLQSKDELVMTLIQREMAGVVRKCGRVLVQHCWRHYDLARRPPPVLPSPGSVHSTLEICTATQLKPSTGSLCS